MGTVLGSLVYFLGPFACAIVVHRLTRARWAAFLVGMPSFLLSQGLMNLLLLVFGLVGAIFGPETAARMLIVAPR